MLVIDKVVLENQQEETKYKKEPNGNFRTGKGNAWNIKKKSLGWLKKRTAMTKEDVNEIDDALIQII